MKTIFSTVLSQSLPPCVAQAHESVVPHLHPHGISMLPDVETIGVAALVLALAAAISASPSKIR